MAKATIAGLTVAIGANTKGFTDAIKEIDRVSQNIAKDLKNVSQSLKMDPGAVQGYSDKFKLLQEQVNNSVKKLKTAKDAINALDQDLKEGKVSPDEYAKSLKALNRNLESAEYEYKRNVSALREFDDAADDAGDAATDLGNIIKGNLIADAIIAGLKSLGDLALRVAGALWQGVKDVASAVWNFTKDSVSAAEEARQTLAKVGQIFGESKQQIIDWSKDAANAVGLSSAKAQEAAASFGNMFAALDVTGVQIDGTNISMAEMSTNLVQLAADVAAFNNTTTENVLDAFMSGLAGTSRQLREYGIVITADLVEQKALELGLAATSKELTEGDKITARYALMMEQAAHQSGQFARESDSATVQTQKLKAKVEDLQAEIGEKLIPIQARFYKELNDFIDSDAGQELFDGIIEAVGALSDKIMELIENGTLEEWINSAKEKIPEIVQGIQDFTKAIVDLMPQIAELVEKLLALFGIETEAEKSRRTFMENKAAVESLAEQYGISIEQMNQAVNLYAENQGLKVSEVYEHWQEHKDGISSMLDTIAGNYSIHFTTTTQLIKDFAKDNGISLNDIYSNWEEYEPQIRQYASTLGGDYESQFNTTMKHLTKFAEDNGLTIEQILNDWNTYEPLINQQFGQVVIDAGQMSEAWDAELEKLPESTRNAIQDTANTDMTPLQTFLYNVGFLIGGQIESWKQMWEGFKSAFGKGLEFLGIGGNDGPHSSGSGSWTPRASGGSGYAFHPYLVGDDAQNRPEIFIPNTDGRFLNGDQTERILNNISNNNSRTFGDVNIYVNSYGTSVSEVADELGTAFLNRIRMSGATL